MGVGILHGMEECSLFRQKQGKEGRTVCCRWVPVQERSRSLALVYSGMYTGSILGLALSPHLIEVCPFVPFSSDTMC